MVMVMRRLSRPSPARRSFVCSLARARIGQPSSSLVRACLLGSRSAMEYTLEAYANVVHVDTPSVGFDGTTAASVWAHWRADDAAPSSTSLFALGTDTLGPPVR